MPYALLIMAVVFETIGTSALNASQQFTRVWPSAIVIASYGISFYMLSKIMQVMPVGLVYALWSGLGIVSIAAIGYLVFGQKLDLPALVGIGLIIAGILCIHLFSSSAPH